MSTVIINDIKYLIKNKNDLIESTLLKGIQWNNEIVLIIGHFIKKYKLKHFVNVGSHIGTVVLPISKYIIKATAIESFPPTFKHFIENMNLNKIKNIDTYNLALGDRDDKVFFLNTENERIKNNLGGMHAVTEKDINEKKLSSDLHSKKFENRMKKLDDLNIENFDIMLIDVEGKEYEMLKGGSKKIRKNQPIIIIEIWGNKKRKEENMSTTREEIIEYICSLDYRLINNINDDFVFFPKKIKY